MAIIHRYRAEDGIYSYSAGDILLCTDTGEASRVVADGSGLALEPARDISICDHCGEVVLDLDAGFSPAVQGMACQCGGQWKRPPELNAAAADIVE